MLTTTRLIEPSARMVTITTLRPGDVYKRLDEPTYGSTEARIQIGVVTDVMHNGEDAAITAVEFALNYSTVEPKIKVFGTGQAPALFPAMPIEVTQHLDEIRKRLTADIESAERKLANAQILSASFERTFADIALTSPETAPYEDVRPELEAAAVEQAEAGHDNNDGLDLSF